MQTNQPSAQRAPDDLFEMSMQQQEKPKQTVEHLYELLYAYRFGTINFVGLVEQMEAILCLPSAQMPRNTPLEQAEVPDDD